MSLRALFFLLLLANLAFLAWAHLIDVPADAPRVDSTSHLPRLRLADEAQAEAQSSASVTHPLLARGASSPADAAAPTPRSSVTPAPQASSSAAPASAAAGSLGTSASGVSPPAAAPPGLAAASSGGTTSGTAGAVAGAAPRCITVGPFADAQQATEAADLLRERGFHPRQHADSSTPERRFWVYVSGFDSYASEQRAITRLQASGIEDAQAMPDAGEGRRVAVGLFSERGGAERRARAVRTLGFTASIEERKQSEPAHWVDVDLNSSTQTLPMDALLSLQETASKLEVRACPVAGQANAVGARSSAPRGRASLLSSKLGTAE